MKETKKDRTVMLFDSDHMRAKLIAGIEKERGNNPKGSVSGLLQYWIRREAL